MWSRLVLPPKTVLRAAGGVQGQPDGIRKHSSRLSCELIMKAQTLSHFHREIYREC